MTGPLPPGDHGNRNSPPSRRSGCRGPVPSAIGLVGGVAAYREGAESEKARRGRDRAGEVKASGLFRKAINALSILALRGFDCKAHLFPEGPTDKPADAVGLPSSGFHDFLQAATIRPKQEFQDLGTLTPFPDGAGPLLPFGGLGGFGRHGRFLGGTGLLPRLAFGWRNTGLLWRAMGLLFGLLLLAGRAGSGSSFVVGGCRHNRLSFRGNDRGHDIHHSGCEQKQANGGVNQGRRWSGDARDSAGVDL